MLISPVAILALILQTIIRSFVQTSHTFIKRPKLGKQKRRYFSGFSVKRLNSELSDAFLNQTTSDDQFNVDGAFSHFYKTLYGLVERHASLKTTKTRSNLRCLRVVIFFFEVRMVADALVFSVSRLCRSPLARKVIFHLQKLNKTANSICQ